jgi:hypothetical protein
MDALVGLLDQIKLLSREAYLENEIEKLSALISDAIRAEEIGAFYATRFTQAARRFVEKLSDAGTSLGKAVVADAMTPKLITQFNALITEIEGLIKNEVHQ